MVPTPTDPPKPLHIGLLGYRSHPHVGGQGIYLHYLSKALLEAGHRVDVISGPPYPELVDGVTLIKLPSLDLYASDNHVTALRWRHLRSWTDTFEWASMLTGGFPEPYTFGRRLLRHFRRHGCPYDIIHDNQSLCHALLTLQRRGLPVVATVHHPVTRDRDLALAAASSEGHRKLIQRWYRFVQMQTRVVRELNHLVTVSRCSRRDIAEAFGRPAEGIEVVTNGVDTETFRPLPEVPRDPWQLITTASSDQPLKGLSVLLRALTSLRPRYPQLRLRVIGKLKENGATARELAQLQLQDCVTFESGISTRQLVTRYAEAAIAVTPSLYEGFGLPAGEAMASGLPLVSSDGGALPEVVGDAGLLVPAGDTAALAEALAELLENPDRRAALGRAGRERVLTHFCWQRVAAAMTRYYSRMLGRQSLGDALSGSDSASSSDSGSDSDTGQELDPC